MNTVSTFVMLMASFDPALTTRSAASLAVLLRGAVLGPRAPTVSACRVAEWPWVKKDWRAYENVLRRAKINMLALARILFALVLCLVPAQGAVYLAIDESLVRRWGPRVPAVGTHRDPVQSSHGRNAVSPGHKWVTLSVVVSLPYMQRPVALPILSVFYTPLQGKRRDEVFFTTDPALTPAQIVEAFVRRWSLETTFQEAREHLGLETLRNWSQKAVKRSVPFLLGLYSLIVLWFALHVEQPERFRVQRPWYKKPSVTFSDMLSAARGNILGELLFQRPQCAPCEHLLWPLSVQSAMTRHCAKSRAA